MKRILLFSYHFPPVGGAGAQRPTKFTRYLREFGYDPVILTRPLNAQTHRWAPADPGLADDLPDDITILRVEQPEPRLARRWRSRLERWAWLRSPWARWWRTGATETARRLSDASIDAVWTIMPPYESAQAAERIARDLDVPWIADLGDPWGLDEMMVYPTRWHRARVVRTMRRSLRSAAAIVMSTPEAVGRISEVFPEVRQKLVVAIQNGYDAADFAGDTPPRTDNRFRIVHAGYLHTQAGLHQRRTARIRKLLGGDTKDVDISTRSHIYLLRAVEALLREHPELEPRIELIFAGVLSEADRRIAEPFGWTTLMGYVDHAASVALIRSADLLFLPMHKVGEGKRATIVPGKTYEYLASGTPILAAIPDGDAKDILREAGSALICSPDDVTGMVEALTTAMHTKAREPRNEAVVQRFEYRNLAQRVANLLDELTPPP